MSIAKKMIVDGMSWADIVEVAKSDTGPVLREVHARAPQYIAKIMSTTRRGPLVFRPFDIPRPSGITWAVRFSSLSKADTKKNGPFFNLYGLFYYRGGLFVIFTYNLRAGAWGVSFQYAIFTPHFFERYRERYLQEPARPIDETISEFFKYNARSFESDYNPDRDGTQQYFCTFAQGVGIAKMEGGVEVVKTFITREMLFSGQADTYARGLDYIREYEQLNL